jgi:hypothetical protein
METRRKTPMGDVENTSWGHPDRHYATHEAPAVRHEAGQQHALKDLCQALKKAIPDARERVEKAVTSWNTSVRDHLRAETGLRLSVEGAAQAVPVRVTDGLPRPFFKILMYDEQASQQPDLIFLWFRLAEARSAAQGTKFLLDEYEHIKRVVELVPKEEVANTHEMAASLVNKLEGVSFWEKWRSIKEDVLGAYFFLKPEVHIYWMPLGLMAGALGVPIDSLTIVTLAHELAHAYTHLGRDIDGFQWELKDFAEADFGVVEGLAQFYCREVCRRVSNRAPMLDHTFKRLEEKLAAEYRSYHEWIEGVPDPKEAIRATMVEARRKAVKGEDDFKRLLEDYKGRLQWERPS